MARTARVVGTSILVVVLAGAAYVTADAYDVVPGVLTLAPPGPTASPFPVAPGALLPVANPASLAPLRALDTAAPVPSTAAVQAAVDAFAADPRVGPSVGVLVTDAASGDVIAERDSASPHVPASTAKLVTAVAALGTLDPASTLPTRVVAGAGGSIVLVGGGDMLLAPGAGDPNAVDGHAGLGDLAAQVARDLKLTGTTTVRLSVDDSLFSGPATSPGWDPSYLSEGFVAPVTPIAVHDARVQPEVEYSVRFPDPTMNAANVFAQRLTEAGITVQGAPSRGTAPADGRVLGEVRSARLDQVVGYVLDSSDNTITEVVSRLVALRQTLPGSFEGGTQAVLRAVSTLGVDVNGAHLTDASGLASGSALPPTLLVRLLKLMVDGSHPALTEIATQLPIAGLTGTLFDRFTQSDARGLVRAKTGSLPNVTSLAGTVVTADGRQLLFAVLADQTGAVGQDPPRRALDAFVSGLAACGCR
ncbi:MAG: D-alanyl-D-alanine carboxypeptidase/D-alanyl-D-alanine-endopeptidase [Cellulomonas sp. 14-74-6]|nr:MAG: D-alanyl-D-alanine carboxypeptidase/D-alanyl-D-alanine-endopeptidase [Cellulomonas sp. 14-74-6]